MSVDPTALVVVDLQNDFCRSTRARARFRGDPARLDAAVSGAIRAVEHARAAAVRVVFVRFLGDAEFQGPSWRRRDAAAGKAPKCVSGTWGAEFGPVGPRPGEAVVTKHACFDAFLGDGIEKHLDGVRRLVFAGLFADVCVDSTARTAFQKGYDITVLSDATTALHLPDEQILPFMATVYGAQMSTVDSFAWADDR